MIRKSGNLPDAVVNPVGRGAPNGRSHDLALIQRCPDIDPSRDGIMPKRFGPERPQKENECLNIKFSLSLC